MEKREEPPRAPKRYVKWTKEQKRTVVEYYRLGYNFAKIAEMVKRSEKSCRNLVYLLPKTETSNKGKWSVEEITLLRKGIEAHGKNWAKVSEYVATRTPMQCKNMYYNILGRTNTDLAAEETEHMRAPPFQEYPQPAAKEQPPAAELAPAPAMEQMPNQEPVGNLLLSTPPAQPCPPELIVDPPPDPSSNLQTN